MGGLFVDLERLWGDEGEAVREPQRLVLEGVVRDDPVDEPQAVGLLGVDQVPRVEQLLCLFQPDEPGQDEGGGGRRMADLGRADALPP